MKAMKYMTASLVVAIFFVMLLLGCKKEQENNNTKETVTTEKNVSKGMLRFSSAEEFAETRQKVLAMGEDERREWERQQGFKSYATKCYELLENLEAKGINSDQDIYDFVKENSQYFYIREEGGEKYLSSYLEETPFNYLVNEKQILKIGDMCVKAFNEGTIWSKSDNVSVLNAITHYDNQRQHEGLTCFDTEKILPNEFIGDTHHRSEQPRRKKYPYDIDTLWMEANTNTYKSYISQRITRHNWIYSEANRNVTKTQAFGITVYEEIPGNYVYLFTLESLIIPYHRVAGIWYRCQRSTSYDISSSWNVPLNGQTNYDLDGTGSGYSTTVFSCTMPVYPNVAAGFKINTYSGWSRTLDTPKLIFPL